MPENAEPHRAAEPSSALELRDVSASSGGFEILSGTSVSFPEGLCSVVMGVAGSGKSTLLKVAAGLVVPDSGSVWFRGADMARFGHGEEFAFRATTGFVFQDSALWADTTILGNVAMPLRVHKRHLGEKAITEAVRALLERLGYDESLTIRPAELSAGEQKLVSIARAVIHEPSIIFMDDPTSNLDEDAAEKVFSLFDELRKKRRTIVVVANSSDLAFRFADRLGVIKAGSMVAFGTYDATVSSAEAALSASLARLRARGSRARSCDDDAGAENSQRGDV